MAALEPDQSQTSLQSLIGELERAHHALPWRDEPQERHEAKMEIIRRVRADASKLTLVLGLLDHQILCAVATEMLGWIGNKEAVKPLLTRLWREPGIGYRGKIALALDRIGTPKGRAAHQEYDKTVRSYPEIVGELADLGKRKGIATAELFDLARRNQAHGICLEDTDEAGALSFDLCTLLAIVGRRARDSQWACRGVECTGDLASDMHAVSDRGLIVSGRTLTHIALNLVQTIEGEFVVFGDDGEAWLLIRAVDSSLFDLLSHEPELLAEIRGHFRCVTELDMAHY